MINNERILPIFPLDVVLFPFMLLPLQIFEDRYKQMLYDCQEADSRFGVCLIQEGVEVGTPAIPNTIGTITQVRQVTELEDARFALLTMGERRFQVEEIIEWYPYEKARVTILEESQGDPPFTTKEIEHIHERLAPLLRSIFGLRGGWTREIVSPSTPIDLSFHIASVIKGDLPTRQRILEANTARERIDLLMPIVEQEVLDNQAKIQERTLLKGIRLN